MIRTVFEWREDQEHGGYGWIPKGFPDFNAVEGRTMAHDCIEHFKATGAPLSDEMMAFGSMLYIRVQGGWFYQMNHMNPSPAYHMGSDIGRFLRDHYYDPDTHKLTNPGVTKPLDDEMEDEIAAIMREGVRSANAECNDDENEPTFEIDHVTAWMTGWIRRGYRKAIKRWKGNRPEELMDLFDRIAAEATGMHRYGDEGDELHVGINPTTLELVMRREYSYH